VHARQVLMHPCSLWCPHSEKAALAHVHARALETAKQAAADERSAWRAAVTERLRRQAGEREEQLRAGLLKQRDEELEVCAGDACLIECAVQLARARLTRGRAPDWCLAQCCPDCCPLLLSGCHPAAGG
jgi:hypothetical protein